MSLQSSTLIYAIGNIIPAMAGFFLLPVFSKYLLPEEYAIIASMEVLAYLYSVFANVNLERAAYRFYFDKSDAQWRESLLLTLHISSIVIAVVLMIVVFLLQDVVTLLFPSISFWPIYVLVFSRVTLEVFLKVPQQYLQVSEKPMEYISLNIIRSVLNVGFVLWFLVVKGEGVNGVFYGNILAIILIVPLGLYFSKSFFKGKFDQRILMDSIKFSWPFVPTLIVAWVINLSDRVFLEYYSSQYELGIYGMAYTVSSIYLVLMGALRTAYLPKYYKYANMDNQDYAVKILEIDSKINVYIIITTVFLIILWSYDLVFNFLAQNFIESADVIIIILTSHMFSSIAAITASPALLQAKKTKTNMYSAIAASIINLGLNFLLIPKYGMYGAAVATVISMIALFYIQYFASKTSYVVKFPWRSFSIMMLICIPILVIALTYIEKGGVLGIIIKFLITLTSIALLLFFIKNNKPSMINDK